MERFFSDFSNRLQNKICLQISAFERRLQPGYFKAALPCSAWSKMYRCLTTGLATAPKSRWRNQKALETRSFLWGFLLEITPGKQRENFTLSSQKKTDGLQNVRFIYKKTGQNSENINIVGIGV